MKSVLLLAFVAFALSAAPAFGAIITASLSAPTTDIVEFSTDRNFQNNDPKIDGLSFSNPRFAGQTFSHATSFVIDKITVLLRIQANGSPDTNAGFSGTDLTIKLYEANANGSPVAGNLLSETHTLPTLSTPAAEQYITFDVGNVSLTGGTLYGFLIGSNATTPDQVQNASLLQLADSNIDAYASGVSFRFQNPNYTIVGSNSGDDLVFFVQNTNVTAHPGDFDGDGDVDGADFVAWQTNFPKASGANLAEGDADADGDVDGADFVVWQTNFPFTPGPGASPVPEPGSWVIALSAMLGILGFGLCHQKK